MRKRKWTREWADEMIRFANTTPRPSKRDILAHMNATFPGEDFSFNSVDRKLRDAGVFFGPRPGKALTVAKPRFVERQAAPDVAKIRAGREDAVARERQAYTPFAPDLSGLPGRRFTDLKGGQCKWEISGQRSRFAFRFCGSPVVPLPPYAYCACHARIAYKMPGETER